MKEGGEISELVIAELVSVSELALDSSCNVVRTLFSVDCGVVFYSHVYSVQCLYLPSCPTAWLMSLSIV